MRFSLGLKALLLGSALVAATAANARDHGDHGNRSQDSRQSQWQSRGDSGSRSDGSRAEHFQSQHQSFSGGEHPDRSANFERGSHPDFSARSFDSPRREFTPAADRHTPRPDNDRNDAPNVNRGGAQEQGGWNQNNSGTAHQQWSGGNRNSSSGYSGRHPPSSFAGAPTSGHVNWGNRQHMRTEAYRFHGHDVSHFNHSDRERWSHGHWMHGNHRGRNGWWWLTDGFWYFYDEPIYPYPGYVSDYYDEDTYQDDYWYYCPDPAGYYPYVRQCRVDWVPVPAQPYGDQGGYYDRQGYYGPDDDSDDYGPPPPDQGSDDYGPPPPDQGPGNYGPPPPHQQPYDNDRDDDDNGD